MGVIVQFDYERFVATFPEMGSVTPDQAAAFFELATTFHANDGSGPVATATLQLTYLNALTAHLAWMFTTVGTHKPTSASGLVGPISSASEGSVSVSVGALSGASASAQEAWLNQSQYGALYWAMTAQYRTVHYASPTRRRFARPF